MTSGSLFAKGKKKLVREELQTRLLLRGVEEGKATYLKNNSNWLETTEHVPRV